MDRLTKIDDRELDEVIYSPVCTSCKHLLDITQHKCTAFDRIPNEIWVGKNNHKKPYPGDHGIQYEKSKYSEEDRKAVDDFIKWCKKTRKNQ